MHLWYFLLRISVLSREGLLCTCPTRCFLREGLPYFEAETILIFQTAMHGNARSFPGIILQVYTVTLTWVHGCYGRFRGVQACYMSQCSKWPVQSEA